MPWQTAIADHLIRTKFYPPRVPRRLVHRQSLIDSLNEGHDRKLTLVCAPAGYGKSTLVHEWLRTKQESSAWLSLDPPDNELDQFLEYLIAALGTIHKELGGDVRSLVRQARLPNPQSLADSLLLDLQGLGQSVYLAIDDFHNIRSNDVNLFMTRLVQRLPENLHLVLISRSDPRLDLAKLRGRGQLQEIRIQDLRFRPQEAAALLEQIVGTSIEPDIVNLLTERTEGWPTGLRMAAMSLRATGNPREFQRRFEEGGHKLVSDYLLSEVLDRLTNADRLLLLRTSIVNRMCAPLIDALVGDSIPARDGYDFLDKLWSANFFLVALDDQGTWYRYHHLFRQLLEQQSMREFSKEEVATMHRRASHWFEHAGYIEEAVFHSLEAGNDQQAAIIVENHVHGPLNQENWRLVDRWIRMLPEESRRRPGLLATQAMIEQLRYRVDRMNSLLDAAEEGIKSGECDYTPAQEQEWMGAINAFRSVMWVPSRTPEDALRYSVLAQQQVCPDAKYVRSVAELGEVLATQMTGDGPGAIYLARRKLAGRIGPPDAITHRLMIAQAYACFCEADARATSSTTNTYLDMVLNAGQQISVSWLLFLRGWAAYQANRLDEAESDFQKIIELRDFAHLRNVLDSFCGLALIRNARGESENADGAIEDLRQFIVGQGAETMLPAIDSLAMRLDQDSTLSSYMTEFSAQPEAQLAADLWELPILTECRRAILSESEEQLEQAKKNLAACYAFALSRNNKRQLLQIGALGSLLHEVKGENQEALACMKTAVSLGRAGRTLRYFVDLGPAVVPLLQRLHGHGFATAYIEEVLSALGEVAKPEGSNEGARDRKAAALSPKAATVLADLTNREMDVLLLLSERLTNKEIAEKLHLSPLTVKHYTLNIYQKLDVGGRRQAVALASELGIL